MDNPDAYRSIKRCPVCFSREIDVLLLPVGDGRHRCVKCSFDGSEAEISAAYKDIQKKYHWMSRRIPLDEQRAL
jgi:hypothetical protein